MSDIREEFADLCHRQWSDWMKYLFSKCTSMKDGSLIIPPWAVARWTRQMSTDFNELPLEDRETDLKEADKFVNIARHHPPTM